MYSAIIPYALDLAAFILIILCLLAGQAPKLLPDFSILALNATDFKANYTNKVGDNQVLPIHDVYSVFLSTHCDGFYANNTDKIRNVTCSRPSPYAKFLIDDIIDKELNITAANQTDIQTDSKEINNKRKESKDKQYQPAGVMLSAQMDNSIAMLNSSDIHFPEKIQREFKAKFNAQLHIAYIFYILALINIGGALAVGVAAIMKGTRGFVVTLLTTPATVCLGISSTIVTVVQASATKRLNMCGNNSGVLIYHGNGFLALTWTAFGLVTLSTPAWWGAAIVSWDYRKNRKGKWGSKAPDPEPETAHE